MTTIQLWVSIALIALATAATRFAPFLLFSGKKIPTFVCYLGAVLPCAVMGLLVVYCLKDVSLFAAPYGIPEVLGVLAVAGLHAWKKNTLLSIGVGTALYMVLVQFVF